MVVIHASIDGTIRLVPFRWSLVSLGLVYVFIVIAFGTFQRRLQYFPHLTQTGMRNGEELRLAATNGRAIGRVHVPVLMTHGEEDEVIPISSAKRLFELANQPKTFTSVPGGHFVLE